MTRKGKTNVIIVLLHFIVITACFSKNH